MGRFSEDGDLELDDDELDEQAEWEDEDFADPGGESALRAESETNPRCHPCPTCGWPDRLTQRDVSLGYQCDSCASARERGDEIDYYEGE